MKVLVDTCIWSLVLRRKSDQNYAHQTALTNLINDSRVQLIGAIRQEILSGVKSNDQFLELKERLNYFPDLPLKKDDYELAAEYYNLCRIKGIQGSNTDFLIAAVSKNYNLEIYTTDKDFFLFKPVVPIQLFSY